MKRRHLSFHLLSEAGEVPDLGHILGLLDLLGGCVLTTQSIKKPIRKTTFIFLN